MSFDVVSDKGTEPVTDEVTQAIRKALGPRLEAGSWRMILRKLPRGYIVDLTNHDGISRQWVFDRDDPAGDMIRRDLEAVR
jgi:hypothetical protein